MGSAFEPPIQYLRECSDNSLRHFEVVKLEHVANLRRELRALWDEMLEESALALLARWMIEHRAELRSTARAAEPRLAALGEPAPRAKGCRMKSGAPRALPERAERAIPEQERVDSPWMP
jgi:hypothetical protein